MTKKLKSVKNGNGRKAQKSEKAKEANHIILLRRKTDTFWSLSDNKSPKKTHIKKEAKFYRRKSDVNRCDMLSDSELVKIVQMQNREIYHELFKRYQKKLFVYMYHLVGNKDEVEDLLQNVFTKTYKSIEHFDTERKFSSWIYRIAHNESVNFLKRKSKKHFVSWEDIVSTKDKLETKSDEKLPEEVWVQQEITEEISNALKKLPDKYKQVLLLRYFTESSYEAIGKILNKPVNTVGTLINRAKKKLTEVIDEEQKKQQKRILSIAAKNESARAVYKEK